MPERLMPSQYPGQCSQCKAAIKPGQMIYYNSAGAARAKARHKDCKDPDGTAQAEGGNSTGAYIPEYEEDPFFYDPLYPMIDLRKLRDG